MKTHYKKRTAFSLAETLIAMVLVGVLSAFVVPAIMKNTPSNNKALFKVAYNNLSRMINELLTDEAHYPSEAVNTALGNIPRGFNYTVKGDYDWSYYNSIKFCTLLYRKMTNITNTEFTSCPDSDSTGTGSFESRDGMYWSVYTPIADNTTQFYANSTTANTAASVQFPLCSEATTNKCSSAFYTTKITVDVNGTDNGPNCSRAAFTNPTVSACASGVIPDTYKIGVRFDGKLDVSTDTAAQDYLNEQTKVTK